MRIIGSLVPVLVFASALAAQEVARVEVTPARASVVAGEHAEFDATAYDATGQPVTGGTTLWIATPFDIAGADSTGRVTTFRPGLVYVIALVDGKPGFGVLEIAERSAARLIIDAPGGRSAVVGDVLPLEARAETEVGDPLPTVPARWSSSDPSVARVEAGRVVGVAPGRARIRAEAEGRSAEIEVEVRANPVASIVIAGVPDRVRTGDVVHLRAEPRDADGRRVGGTPVRWSLGGPGASVDTEGAFVAEAPGLYRVVASVGGISAASAVRVLPRNDPRTVTAVAHVPLPDGVQAAEIWPVGDAAYVSTIAGAVYVFDISDPSAPVLTDSLKVDARLVNDVSTTSDGSIGVLSREGASDRKNGLVFFDASDPLHPHVISEFSEAVSGGVHSAFVYGHHVFATDDATGSLRIIDFQDPRNPQQVVRWEIPREDVTDFSVMFLNVAPQRYLHDVYVEDGLAYLAYWRDGLVILDVGNGIRGGSITEPRLVSQFRYNHAELYPPGYVAGTHAVFRHGDYVFVGDESYSGTVDLFSRERFATRGLLHVIDVSDIENPRKVAGWDPVEFGVHNFWVEDDLLYMGAYDGGLRVFDVSGELRGDLGRQGRQVAAIYTGSVEGFRPNVALTWGAIPHKGYIFASDINSGLWVARVTGAPVP